jgi:hypothetical protein
MASVIESLAVKLALDAAAYDEGFKKAQGGLDSFAGNAAKIGGALSLAVTTPVVAFGTAALGMASDLNETTSKVQTLFGEQATAVQAWSSTSAEAYGLSQQAALDSVATIGNMFMQLGAGSEQAATTGQGMVQLAADLASFHNVAGGSEEVLTALNAAFRGEYDSLQRYIPTINAAAVEQAALAATGKTTASELTALEKATAVQTLAMEGAGAAVGDFARTSDGLANTQRIVAAEMANLSAELGQVLLPIALDVAKGLSGLLAWFKDLSPETKKWVLIIAGAAAAIAPVLLALAGMAAGISAIMSAAAVATPIITAIGVSIGALAAPIAIVIAAVAALALAWSTDFGGIRTKTEGFWTWITGEWPGWMDGLKTGWQGFSDWWQSDTETKVASVKSGWETFNNWLGQNATTAVGGVKTQWQTFYGWLDTNTGGSLTTAEGYWTTFSNAVQGINTSMWQTLQWGTQTGVDATRGVITAALQFIQGDWQGGLNTLQTTAQGIWQSIYGQFQTQIDAIMGIFSGTDWGQVGSDIVQGIANGIDANLSWIRDAAEDAAQAALDAAKWILGIGSPSKVAAAEVGSPFTAGVAVGAEDEVPVAATRIQDALDRMVGQLAPPSLGVGGGVGGNTINITIHASDADTANQARLGLLDGLRQVGLA